MKVKIGDIIYDSENEPIMLIFETDAVRQTVANHLLSMQPRFGIRLYVQAPVFTPKEELDAFMKDPKNEFTVTGTKKIQ